MEKNLEKLLTLVKEVCDDHRQYKKGFNVITTFVKPHREVELHSRFITWLLDPKNDYHGLGTLPLELFLKQLNSQFKVSSTTKVVPNASNWTEDRDMDILIYDREQNFAIVIENKIYAKDSDKGENNGQLARYYFQVLEDVRVVDRNIKNNNCLNHQFQNIELFFLTLDGHEPEEKTFKTQDGQDGVTIGEKDSKYKKKYKKIKYLDHIEPWLKRVLNTDNCKSNPQTTDLILQYLDALHCVSPDVKLNHDLFAVIGKDKSLVEALQEFLIKHKKLINKSPEKIEENLEKEERDEYKIEAPLWATAIFLIKNHRHLYWHALNDLFIKLQDELHSIFGDNLLPRIDINTGKEKTIDKYVSEIIFEEKNASKLSPMYYRIRLANGKEWTLQPNRSRGFFLGIDCTTKPNKEIKSHDLKGYSTKENGWYAVKYLEDKKEALNLWDFTQGQTFDLLNKEKRQEIAKRYAAFVEQELNKIN